MGAVYQVRHKLLDEVRVMKFMRAAMTGDPDMERRFVQEAKLVTRFKHPNIAAIYDFAIDDEGTAYIVMEYVAGLNLVEAATELRPLSVAFVLEVTAQTLDALGYIHRKNVVHRDISPDNVMVAVEDDAVNVKLIDLGIAKALDAPDGATKTGFFIGKLKYASPEQLGALEADERLDGRTDLYSLGVVMYELLTGRLPVVGTSAQAYIAGHLSRPPASFESSDPEGRVPESVRSLVMQVLAKDRNARFASAEEMRDAIRAILRELPSEPLAEDVVKLRRVVEEQERARAVAEPAASSSAQERLDRRISAVRLAAIREEREEPTRLMDATRTLVPSTAGTQSDAPIAVATPGAAPPRRGAWIVAAAAVLAALVIAAFAIVNRTPPANVESTRTASGGVAALLPPSASPADTAGTVVPETASAPLQAAPNDSVRAAAQQARTRALAARTSAIATNADPLPVFRRGTNVLLDADELETNGDFGSAIPKFAEAERLFNLAAAAARGDDPPPAAETPRPAEPQQQPRSSDPPHTETVPDRTPERVAAPAPRVAEERRPEPPAASGEDGVRAAIAEFVNAQKALDAERYTAIFPSADRARISAAFAMFRSQELKVTIESIDVSGDRATVRVLEERVAVPKVGSVQRVNAARTLRLERTGGRWLVAALQ